jgi:MetJ family transcriptional regulator, methionine regulon repressor
MPIDIDATLMRVLRQLESQRAAIDRKIEVVRIAVNGASPTSEPAQRPVRRRPMSAGQRREVSRRMKKYWATRRAAASAKAIRSTAGSKTTTANKPARKTAAKKKQASRSVRAVKATRAPKATKAPKPTKEAA